MAIIVDTNCFANVFNTKSVKHKEFESVLKWIIAGQGLLVFGGTKYLDELKESKRYLKIINLLKIRKLVSVCKRELVDKAQDDISSLNSDPKFNDPHIAAIIYVSKCCLVCTEDIASIPFLKDKENYPGEVNIPKFYTGSRNSDLLCQENIHEQFKPLLKLKKAEAKDLIVKIEMIDEK